MLLRALRQPLRWVFPKAGAGFPALRQLLLSLRGLEGAVLAPFLAKHFKITDPVAEGVAIGPAAMPLAR